MNQKVLQVGCFFRLPAHSFHGATGIFGSFLTLKTKHRFSPYLDFSLDIREYLKIKKSLMPGIETGHPI